MAAHPLEKLRLVHIEWFEATLLAGYVALLLTCDQAFFLKSGRVVKTKWYERAQRVSKLIAFLREKIKFSIVKPPSNFYFTIPTKVLAIFLSHSQHQV